MHPLDSNYIPSLAESPAAEKARNLLKKGQLWKFFDRLDEEVENIDSTRTQNPPGYAGAYVLENKGEPSRVLWNESGWNCECGSELPCTHLNVLLVHLTDKRQDDWRFSALIKEESRPEPGFDFEIDSRLNPEQDLLFFVEPDNLEKKDVLVLGAKKTMSPLKAPTDSENDGVNFADLKGGSWSLRPAKLIVKEDGSTGPLRPLSSNAAAIPKLPVPANIGPELISLLGSEDPPVTPGGKPWHFEEAGSIHLRFEPLLSAANSDPLYEAVVDLRAGDTSITGGMIAAEEKLLVLDESTAVAAVLENTGDYLWFIRLMLSRKVLSTSDIRARVTGNNRIPVGIEVEIPDLPESLKVLDPVLVLKISSRGGVTDFIPLWRYATAQITPERKGNIVTDKNAHPLGLRNRVVEEELLSRAEALLLPDLSWQRGRYSRLSGSQSIPLRLEMPLSEVLTKYGSTLIDSGVEIRLEDRPVKKGGALQIQAQKNGDILELNTLVVSESGTDSLNLDEWFERGGLAGTREAYFTLTDKALEQLNFLQSHGMEDSGFLSTSPDNLSLIDALYSEIEAAEETVLELERKRSIYRSLSNFNPENYQNPPGNFNAELRPYQLHGYAWLLHLKEKNLGGCLADDMGLGKTVQALAYLTRLKADGELGISLMVGPVVTLANWEAEMRRFAPDLKYHRYSGPAWKRYLPGPGEDVDLIIVSYQTLRNDIEKFIDRDWDHIILDEAHYVKNASSRTFKAVKSIKAAHRLSLTGTPLENHLNELWSQMSFLNPGLLGSRNGFIQRYVKPVEKDGDDVALVRLSETVAPFILRRKKSEVLHDLPPKDETVLRCDMTDDQAEAYHTARELYFRQVSGLLSDEGLSGARIQIFTILSKLRLLAIHPPLAGEQFSHITSGKMAVLDSLMEEILEEDHKTLVFSQFLGALDRTEKTCRRHNWQFSRLTGSTKNREEPIRNFQENPDTRVFLLSLRAGGVGINLTAADYVILLDPWWNPAVEAQAVDRAHRMGQTRPVMAYRLITAGTIEEKVLELQEKKKNLIAGVLGEGENPKLTDSEILKLFE